MGTCVFTRNRIKRTIYFSRLKLQIRRERKPQKAGGKAETMPPAQSKNNFGMHERRKTAPTADLRQGQADMNAADQKNFTNFLDSQRASAYISVLAARNAARVAGWSSSVARRAHNPKVVGSNPAPATR